MDTRYCGIATTTETAFQNCYVFCSFELSREIEERMVIIIQLFLFFVCHVGPITAKALNDKLSVHEEKKSFD